MDKNRILIVLYLLFAIWFFTNQKSGPTVLSPEAQAAITAAQPPKGALLTGQPVELANESLKLKFDLDGTLISTTIKRFDEEILAKRLVPDEITRAWTEKKITTPPPVYSAGITVARPPLFLTDERRMHLAASHEPVPHGVKFATSEPEGIAIPKGLAIERTWVLDEKRHLLDLDVTLKNTSGDILNLSTAPPVHMFAGPMLAGDRIPAETFVHDGAKLNVVSPSAAVTEVTSGAKWIGVRNNYFALILHHQKGPGIFVHQAVSYHDPVDNKTHVAPVVGFKTNVPFIAKGGSETFKFKVFLGPKTEADLGADYASVFNNWDGWTGLIAHLCFFILRFFHTVTGSYGIAVLLLTLLVKCMLHPLSFSQTENMAKMQSIQPRIQEIKERYKDNPEQMQAETMKLWQEHGYNPVGGCLPMFLQIPIFIGLYNSIQYAIELKGVGFWWMADLSKPDSTTLLALLFALSVYVNSKLMQAKQSQTATAAPAGADQDMQVVMNRMMPIMMYGMFVMMPVPGGVMIYLATQSLLGIVETRYNMIKMKNKSGKRSKA